MKLQWSIADIEKLFRITESRTTIYNAEKKKEIPQAVRIPRGSVSARVWPISAIPEIGRKFGFLKKPNEKVVITVYAPKGGILKTCVAYTLAEILALNGIKVLIIGLETIQKSITNYTLPRVKPQTIEDIKNLPQHKGLYHLLSSKAPLNEVIVNTLIPGLDIIPETPELQDLDHLIEKQTRREFVFKEKLIPMLDYDVIIFDNGSKPDQLVRNALAAANNVIVPMGCEYGAFDAIDNSLRFIFDYQKEAHLSWDNFFQLPTLLNFSTNISRDIKDAYFKNYIDTIVTYPIRRSAKGEEAQALNQSIFQYAPTSDLATDYYEAISYMWHKILDKFNAKTKQDAITA